MAVNNKTLKINLKKLFYANFFCRKKWRKFSFSKRKMEQIKPDFYNKKVLLILQGGTYNPSTQDFSELKS